MTESSDRLPELLREMVAVDLEPVRPLPPAWKRILWALPVALAIFLVPVLTFGLREQAESMSVWLSWVPVILQVSLGIALFALVLRDCVPGERVSRTLVGWVCLAAFGVHLGVNLLIWFRYPMGYEASLRVWWLCFRYEFLLGLPFLLLIAWLASSALPMRPRTIGVITGASGGFIAEASWRMICPASHPLHVITAHGIPIVVLGGLGYLFGALWEQHSQRHRPSV